MRAFVVSAVAVLLASVAGLASMFVTTHEIATVCEIREAQTVDDPAVVVVTSAGEYTILWRDKAEFLPQIKKGGTYRLGQAALSTRLKEVQIASPDKAEGKCP